MPGLVAYDGVEHGPGLVVAAPGEPLAIGLELLASPALAAMHEGQEPDLAEPFEQVLDVGVRKTEAGAAFLCPQLARAHGEHLRVAGLIQQMARVERRAVRRRREPGRGLEVEHAAVLGQRETVQLASAMPRNPPDDGVHDPG